MAENGASDFHERAYDYFLAALYDDWYPELSDETKGPFRPICELLKTFKELSGRAREEIRILDCACGTGNDYIAFTKAGYDMWATDGSSEMLIRAVRNSENILGSYNEKLITNPINWTDWEAYRQCFAEKVGSFDVILINSNSFCHLPSTPEYMQVALNNFCRLLKPGGRLIIDTKKYVRTMSIDGLPIFMELQYIATENEWIVRSERLDPPRKIAGKYEVHFHTRLHYDIDPYFKICRALIVVTMYGNEVAPRTMVLPYYPLPAKSLEQNMKDTGFVTTVFPAKEGTINWSYDFVVGQTNVQGSTT
jgi:SAM-dependent methyltransferase